MADKDKDKQYKYRQEIQQPLRRSARIQRSESAKPSQTPQASRKPKRTASMGNPAPQTTRGGPMAKSSGPQLQQVSTPESQQSPSNKTTRRRITIKIKRKNAKEKPSNSPDEPAEDLSAGTAVQEETGVPVSSESPPQALEPPTLDNFQGLSVFQNSSGPDIDQGQHSSLPPSVLPISNGPDSLPSADVA
ncbi:hypothetical protein B0T20DRAFT_498422 [Sordaria brevicollis]|uniref:Uncharacterized protein n=1 Tax=Sordaria brevicollis TaxID=83679 RepID=A0AAE0PEI3_SORBR|nr:hypothetical protein B0T20DRAFT_498422 [Sordaria brevicollis]